jgi:hypothetical protein
MAVGDRFCRNSYLVYVIIMNLAARLSITKSVGNTYSAPNCARAKHTYAGRRETRFTIPTLGTKVDGLIFAGHRPILKPLITAPAAGLPHKVGDEGEVVGTNVRPYPAAARPPVGAAQDMVDADAETQHRQLTIPFHDTLALKWENHESPKRGKPEIHGEACMLNRCWLLSLSDFRPFGFS